MSEVEKKAELHAVWEGYLLSKIDEAECRVLKVEVREDGSSGIVGRHTVKRGKCDCKGFEHRLDCRHVKLVHHRQDPFDRAKARSVVADTIEKLETWPEFDRVVLDGYETDGEDDSRARLAILRAWGRPFEFDGVKHWKILGWTKGVVIEVRIEGR